MANIRVTCPACKSQLEIDATFEGQEVECGNCLQVFVAKRSDSSGGQQGEQPSASRRGGSSPRGGDDEDAQEGKPRRKRSRYHDDEDDDEDRGRRGRRRRDEDDEDYYSPPPRRSGSGNGLAVTSLILGIFSIFPGCCCTPFSIPIPLTAIVTGSIAMKNPDGKGMAIAGVILGVCGLVIEILWLVLNIGMGLNNPNRFR